MYILLLPALIGPNRPRTVAYISQKRKQHLIPEPHSCTPPNLPTATLLLCPSSTDVPHSHEVPVHHSTLNILLTALQAALPILATSRCCCCYSPLQNRSVTSTFPDTLLQYSHCLPSTAATAPCAATSCTAASAALPKLPEPPRLAPEPPDTLLEMLCV